MTSKITVFCDMRPGSLVDLYKCFREMCYSHLQGVRLNTEAPKTVIFCYIGSIILSGEQTD